MMKLQAGSILIFGFSTYATNTDHGLKKAVKVSTATLSDPSTIMGALIQLCSLCYISEDISTKQNPK